MKKYLLLFIIIILQFSFAQYHHGISFRRTNKGTAINYSLSALAKQDFKYIFRTGFHIENSGSGFTFDSNNYDLVEVPLKQITYIPVSAELNYTLFRDSMENSFLPLLCVEMGSSTGLGKIKDTFSHQYESHLFGAVGLGAEFSHDQQKFQVTLRYYQSEKLNGNVLLDFTFYWK